MGGTVPWDGRGHGRTHTARIECPVAEAADNAADHAGPYPALGPKARALYKRGATLIEDGITAIPPLVWVKQETPENGGGLSEDDKIINRLGFLVISYCVEFWWWEQVEMMRKFLMTSALVFIHAGRPAQLAAGARITFIFLMVNMAYRPYCTAVLNSLAKSSTAITSSRATQSLTGVAWPSN